MAGIFSSIDKGVDRLGYWIGTYTLLSGALSWLAKKSAILVPYGWPEAIFVGLAAACLLMLVGSIGLIAWRLFRPVATSTAPVSEASSDDSDRPELISLDAKPYGLSVEEVNQIVTQRLATIPPPSVALLDEAVEKRLAVMEAQNATLSQILSDLRGGIEALARKAVQTIDAQNEFQEKIEKWIAAFCEDFNHQINGIDQGFMAILDREHLLDLAKSIEELGHELSGPTNGEPVQDWGAWEKGCRVWMGYVENWVRIAGEHRAGVKERVHQTTSEDYRGEWKAKDEYFPNALAVQDYKTFRIICRNFHAERNEVDRCVRMDAFVPPSKKGRPHPAPRGADQLPRSHLGTE